MRRNVERLAFLVGSAILLLIATNAGAETVGITAAEWRVFQLTNQERVAMGLTAVRWDDSLARAAQGHAANMASTLRFAHTLDGQNPGQRIHAAGFPAERWTENMYYGGSGYGSPESAVAAWMDSPEHRMNLLDSKVRYLGVGVRRSAGGLWFFVQNFARP